MQKGLSVNILMTHHVNKLKEQYHFNGRQKVFVKIWQLFIIKEKKISVHWHRGSLFCHDKEYLNYIYKYIFNTKSTKKSQQIQN